MKKKVLFRSLLGLLSGVAIGQLIAIVISAAIGDGMFHAVIPQVSEDFGGELTAAVAQTALLGAFGAVVGAASVVWEIDGWSLTKQTAVHFCLLSVSFAAAAHILYWVPRTVGGAAAALLMLVAIYAGIWCCAYFSAKRKIGKINDKLGKDRDIF